MLTLSNLVKISDEYFSIHYEDRINQTLTTLSTFSFDCNFLTFNRSSMVFKKNHLNNVLLALMKYQFKVSNQFIQSLYNLNPISNNILKLKSINEKLKEDLIELPSRDYIPKSIKLIIYNHIINFNLPELISEILFDWILKKLASKCFLKYLLFVSSLSNNYFKLKNITKPQNIHLGTIFHLLSLKEISSKSVLNYPFLNITFVTRSGMFIHSNKLINVKSNLRHVTNKNESDSNIVVPFFIKKHSICSFSNFELSYCSKFYHNQLPQDYKYYTEHNYNTVIHSIGRFNNDKLVSFMKQFKNINPTTEILMEFPDKIYKSTYWKSHIYSWNYNFTNFKFKVYDDTLYNLESQNERREKLIMNRIQKNFKTVFYMIFECDNFGIKMNYNITPKKLIEFLTLILSIHPKYYIYHFKTADKFYEFYKEIDALFYYHNNTEELSEDEKESFEFQTMRDIEVNSEEDAHEYFIFNILRFKYKTNYGPCYKFNLSKFLLENSDEIKFTLSKLDADDEDYSVYFC